MVNAGFKYASLLPQAMAVNMPAITANAHPAVITIHPEPSALERFSKTPATTPFPSNIITRVPKNSPSSADLIEFPFVQAKHSPAEGPALQTSPRSLQPIGGLRHGALPVAVHFVARFLFHVRLPGLLHCPIRSQLVQV